MPEFEVERTTPRGDFDRVESYPEYPGTEHPMPILAQRASATWACDAIGADSDGYPGILGYQGPALSEVTGATVSRCRAVRSRGRWPGRARPRSS